MTKSLLKQEAIKIKHKQDRVPDALKVWENFKEEYGLTDDQVVLFDRYANLLEEWNQKMNLTALEGLSAIVNQHFKDSLAVKNFIDFTKIKSLADVGTGAGFPGLALKICFPHLRVLLIEVSQKKQEFLHKVIETLNFSEVEVVGIDWRTFLRKTAEDIELFVTKAALDELELTRMFRTTSSYRSRELIYWVSGEWECNPHAQEFVRRVENYRVARKDRKLVILGLPAIALNSSVE